MTHGALASRRLARGRPAPPPSGHTASALASLSVCLGGGGAGRRRA